MPASEMLKIWKRTWKQTDPSSKSQTGLDSGQAGTLDGPRHDALSSSAVEAAPSSGTSLNPLFPTGQSNYKRPLKDVDHETNLGNPSFKKARPDEQIDRDSLGNHLPEMNDSSQSAPPSLAVFRDQVVEQAQRENSKSNLLWFRVVIHTHRPNPNLPQQPLPSLRH